MDGINDSDVGKPGKVETVMRVLQQEETYRGGWEVVHCQRKTREKKAAAGGKGGRTGNIERMFLALLFTRTVAQVEELIKRDGMERALHSERVHSYKLQTKK